MRLVLIASFAALLPSLGFATEIIVYRWVDENNVVHFSQHQPEHDNYTELTMTEALKAKQVEKSSKSAAFPQPASKFENEQCKNAKKNVETLKSFDNVQITTDEGETRILTKEEKSKQLDANEQLVKVYCK